MIDANAPRSPIAEALFEISRRADFRYDQAKREIIVFSDMVQNSELFSFFERGVNWNEFELATPAFSRKYLEGVNIRIRLIERPNLRFSRVELMNFWEQFAAQTGASIEWI
jgi:hypothetical protein